MTVGSSLVLISFQEQPEHFPSASAKAQKAVEFDVATDLQLLKENGNYLWITVSFMMAYGYYTGMGALMNGLMAPYGYNLSQTGSIATVFILSGIAGSFVFSILIGKTQKYLLHNDDGWQNIAKYFDFTIYIDS